MKQLLPIYDSGSGVERVFHVKNPSGLFRLSAAALRGARRVGGPSDGVTQAYKGGCAC